MHSVPALSTMSSTRIAAPPVDVADDVHDLRHAGAFAPLVDDREIGVEPARDLAGAHDAADIGRDDHELLARMVLADVLHEHRRGDQIVGRDVEKALDLAGVQIDRQDPVGAGGGDQIGDQLGRDRRARSGFAILSGIAVIRDDRRDPPRRAALQRVERDEQLHQMVVRRVRGRLDHEYVLAADVLVDLDKHLHVGEAAHAGSRQRQAEIGRDRLGKRPIAVAGKDLHRRRGNPCRRAGPAASRAGAF